MSSSSPSFAMSGACDLPRLSALRTELLDFARAHPGDALHLDLGAVEAGDVGLVQLLLSFHRSLLAEGRTLTMTLSGIVDDLFRRAGAPVPGAA